MSNKNARACFVEKCGVDVLHEFELRMGVQSGGLEGRAERRQIHIQQKKIRKQKIF